MRAVLLLYIINFRVKVTSGLVKKALILTANQNNINAMKNTLWSQRRSR